MKCIRMEEIKSREMLPGFTAKMVHSDDVTIAFWTIKAGSSLPAHTHPHEQFSFIQEGQIEFVVGGETRVVGAGEILYFGPEEEHGGKALTDCTILDVFHPARESYRGK